MRSHFIEIVLWGSWPLNKAGQEDHSQNYVLNLSWGWGLHFLLLIYLTIKGEYFLSQLASPLGLIYCCCFCPRKLDPVTCPKVLRETQTWTPVWEKHPKSPYQRLEEMGVVGTWAKVLTTEPGPAIAFQT